jgi:phospholipase/lecithinase/hemolysin
MRALIATVLLAAAAPAAAYTPSSMVFFGDSFIDAGAVNQFSGGAIAPAALGFYQGRFSNGPTWADLISRRNLGNTVKTFYTGNAPGTIPGLPGFTYTPGATNFAVGGARAIGDDGLIPGLPSQVGLYGQYLAATGDLADARTLFVLNFGNNDVTLLQLLAGDPAAQAAAAATYVSNMVGTASFLAANGAKHILIAGVPNPTRMPGPALQAALDAQLDLAAPSFAAAGVSLYRFDYFDFFARLEDDPTQFGLPATLITDQSRFCQAEVLPEPGMDCSNYLIFDGIHVTAGVQRAISFEIEKLVGLRGVVPEPATWGMMILGFGAVGFAMRRRRDMQVA